jgi:subtilisin family serine protease
MSEMRGALPIIVLRLAEPAPVGDDLRELAIRAGYRGLSALLSEWPEIEAGRAIQGISPKELLDAEQRGRGSDFPPLHSLTSYWRLDCAVIPDAAEELIERLDELPEVGLAYRESETSEPGIVTNPELNPLYDQQGYLASADAGIGVTSAWALVDGSGVGFGDVEKCWLVDHEDLLGLGAVELNGNDTTSASSARHGAAVLGIVAGRNNTLGVIGVAPGVIGPRLSTQYIGGAATPNVAGAVLAAILAPSALAPGDVLLIEVQRDPDLAPVEADNLPFTAIRLASALGIIVVEAAGNGDLHLASFPTLDPASSSFLDSGAILVGGGTSTIPHGRAGSTNFGARVDCYAWGQNVTVVSRAEDPSGGILDDEAPAAGAPETERYTQLFGGTSAAAAIVAGAAVLVQDVYQRPTPTRPAGERLSPRRMRELLKTHATDSSAGAAIGRMPNLARLVTVLGDVPDLYIRDHPGDNGVVPSAGAISVSPDVVVSKTSVAPSVAFTAGASEIEPGQDNFVYVRISNRNVVAAANAKVRVFWSEVDTLITPDDWTPLNPTVPPQADATVTVPANAWLHEAPEIVWQQGNLPAPGHYCFVATVDHPLDPEPLTAAFDVDPLLAWDAFFAFIRNNNNATWRNFNVAELPPPGGEGASEAFLVSGAPDSERTFDLEILQSCPEAIHLRWELPLPLLEQLDADFEEVEVDEKRRRATALLRPSRKLVLPGVTLEKSTRHPCRFLLDAAERLPEASCTIAIRQLYERFEVGRITWELRPAVD